MTMGNDRYAPAIIGFHDDDSDSYVGASAAPFNQITNDGFFAAVLFWISSTYQRTGNNQTPNDEFIWGNLSGNTGWGIGLTAVAGEAALQASVGNGAAVRTLELPFAAAAPLPNSAPGYVERLILASISFNNNGEFFLGCNGSIVAQDITAGTYAPSAVPPSLGRLPGGGQPATDVAVVCCSYYGQDADHLVAMGAMFRSARACMGVGSQLMDQLGNPDIPFNVPWMHLYEAGNASLGAAGRFATVFGQKAYLAPSAPASVADLGSGTATPLTRTAGSTQLQLVGIKNPDWYASGAFQFIGGPA